MASKNTFADVAEAARRGFAQAQLDEEGSHFPYKREAAHTALATPPEEGTNNHPQHWYTSTDIIDSSAAMVAAQEALLREPGDATQEAYEQAKRDLVAARQAHRRGRPAGPVAVAGDPAELEQRRSAVRALGAAGYDAATIARLTSRPVSEVQGALAGRED